MGKQGENGGPNANTRLGDGPGSPQCPSLKTSLTASSKGRPMPVRQSSVRRPATSPLGFCEGTPKPVASGRVVLGLAGSP